jgi:hypothetical protein
MYGEASTLYGHCSQHETMNVEEARGVLSPSDEEEGFVDLPVPVLSKLTIDEMPGGAPFRSEARKTAFYIWIGAARCIARVASSLAKPITRGLGNTGMPPWGSNNTSISFAERWKPDIGYVATSN